MSERDYEESLSALTTQQTGVKLVLDAWTAEVQPHGGLVAKWISILGSAEAVREIVWKYPQKNADYIAKVVLSESKKPKRLAAVPDLHIGADGHDYTLADNLREWIDNRGNGEVSKPDFDAFMVWLRSERDGKLVGYDGHPNDYRAFQVAQNAREGHSEENSK